MKTLDACISYLRDAMDAMPDRRTGKNLQYSMANVGLAAFSVFFMQRPSFLSAQRALRERFGKDNALSLFQIDKIPTDNHIRKLLDGISPSHFDNVFFYALEHLINNKSALIRGVLGDYTLVALDGSEYFCSNNIKCSACNHRKRANGEIEYFHTFVAATIVKPHCGLTYSLPPEFVTPQDGSVKQDCEYKAALRWLQRVGPLCFQLKPIYLGDDLYAKNEICERILDMKGSFIFTCKDNSHKTLFEFRKGLSLSTYETYKGSGKQKRKYCYNFVTDLPIRDGNDAVKVHWFEIIISRIDGKETYRNSFITNIIPTMNNITELADCARCRWKIENETFNVLKNNGYHLEHNFGHGKQTLASVLVILNLLAFTFHNVAEEMEYLWRKAREARVTRYQFFNDIGALSSCLLLSGWDSLMEMLIDSTRPQAP